MAITLNHTIVHARDAGATARFLTSILGLPPSRKLAHFTVVDVGATSLDLIETAEPIAACNFAFLVDEAAFDAIFARVRAAGIAFFADPFHREPRAINHCDDGRGIYFASFSHS